MLASGIQEPEGGVARYYRAEESRNLPVSTEITGYAVSALCYLYRQSGDAAYLAAARRAARFLSTQAWDPALGVFPFEWRRNGDGPPPAYFFDCGIIARGLLALYRVTGEAEWLDRAAECGRGMARDFFSGPDIHPILALPSKQPVPYGEGWSRSPGCYQLKSALAWRELAQETGDAALSSHYERALDRALATHASFLPGASDRSKVMDRLHAYSYFLEAILCVADHPECRRALGEGIARTAALLRDIAPQFARSDVYAQLLRVRLFAHYAGAVPLDEPAACEEAEAIPAFQMASSDPRIDGGFSFGRRHGALSPHINPVSTSFCLQALTLWRRRLEQSFSDSWQVLI